MASIECVRLARPTRRGGGGASRTTIALCALMVGVATYAFLRPHAAAFLPAGWHRPQMHGLPTWLLGGLPTFVHTLAMALLTAIVIGSARVATLRAICAAWCAVEITFELMQHATQRSALLAGLPAEVTESVWFTPLASFVRRGTFDPLDIAAAMLASSAACAILIRSRTTPSHTMEARHA